MGMMASVRVSFTIVAASSVLAPGCMPSHAAAAAVTEEVSFTAVPAKSPKPSLVRPSIPPSVGNTSAAITLKRKITLMAWAISSSSASITGAVAAMAEPPQMEDPTPMSVEILLGMLSVRQSAYETMQRGGNGREDDGKRRQAHPRDLGEVEAEAQQDDRPLKHLLGRELDAGGKRVALLGRHQQGEHHADEDGEDRAPNDLEPLAQKPCRHGDGQRKQHASPHLSKVLDEFHMRMSLRRPSCLTQAYSLYI